MFKTRDESPKKPVRGGAMSGSEHASTLASSVVGRVRQVISAPVDSDDPGAVRVIRDIDQRAMQRDLFDSHGDTSAPSTFDRGVAEVVRLLTAGLSRVRLHR
jgi:hypothetical protein